MRHLGSNLEKIKHFSVSFLLPIIIIEKHSELNCTIESRKDCTLKEMPLNAHFKKLKKRPWQINIRSFEIFCERLKSTFQNEFRLQNFYFFQRRGGKDLIWDSHWDTRQLWPTTKEVSSWSEEVRILATIRPASGIWAVPNRDGGVCHKHSQRDAGLTHRFLFPRNLLFCADRAFYEFGSRHIEWITHLWKTVSYSLQI